MANTPQRFLEKIREAKLLKHLALAIRNRGYTNKVRLRGLREN